MVGKNAGTATHGWSARVEDMLNECAASPPCETQDRLRDVFCLLAGREQDDGGILPAGLTPQEFGRMLACGAYESAAIALIGPDAAFLVSRAGSTCMATVVRHGGRETWGEATTPALALLCAHLASLSEAAGRRRIGSSEWSGYPSRLN